MSEISSTLAEIIAGDSHGPFPELGQQVRCFLRDGQVIDGTVDRIWLDLDIVRVDVIPSSVIDFSRPRSIFRVTPAEGDEWK